MAGIRIIGTGSFPGDKIVTNSDMEKIVDTSDQWIVSKTGIRSRYFADKLTNADMAYEAAVKALDDAKITAEDISVCIVCTFTRTITRRECPVRWPEGLEYRKTP